MRRLGAIGIAAIIKMEVRCACVVGKHSSGGRRSNPCHCMVKYSHTGLGKVKCIAAEAAREGEKSDEGASAVNMESNMDAEVSEATEYGYL